MADFTNIFLLTCLGIISCSGTTLNLMTIYVLLFNRALYEKVASVRWLMLGEALADTITCCIGVPNMFANILVGDAPPYTTVPFLCHINELLGFAMTYVSLWYQTTIALSRLAAVMAPNWYRTKLSRPLGTVLLIIWPWFIGYVGYVFGAIFKAYYISPTPGTGTCVPNTYDNSTLSAARLSSYLFSDATLHSWIPMGIGLSCYVLIYSKTLMMRFQAQKKDRGHIVVNVISCRTGASGHELSWSTPQANSSSQLNQTKSKWHSNNFFRLLRNAPHKFTQQQVAAATKAPVGTTLNVRPRVSSAAATEANQNTTVSARPQNVPANRIAKRKDERDKKIKLLAIAYVVNITLTFPLMGFAWGLDYYTFYSNAVPFFARTLDVMYFMAFPTTPIIYVLVSQDFRQAFRESFLRRCLCCRAKTTTTTTSTTAAATKTVQRQQQQV